MFINTGFLDCIGYGMRIPMRAGRTLRTTDKKSGSCLDRQSNVCHSVLMCEML
jgi:hypothetical protein